MKRIKKLLLLMLLFSLLVVLLPACRRESQAELKENLDYIKVDKPSVDFELEDLSGKKIKLSDYEGQIVFLNFWATWCPPCRHEMPYMESIHQQYEGEAVILAVSSTELELSGGSDSEKAREQVESFISDNGFTFPIPLDPDNQISLEYNKIYPMIGIPTTYMIDREGTIRYVRPGGFQDEAQIKTFIDLFDK